MKELYIVRNTEREAQEYQDKVFALKLRERSVGDKLIRDSDKKIVNIKSLSDDELNEGFVLYGKIKGRRELEKGKTDAWDVPRQRVDEKMGS